jgi:membrane dipeptidase
LIVDTLFAGPCGYRAFSPDVEGELLRIEENTRRPVLAYTAALLWHKNARHRAFHACWTASGITAASHQILVGDAARLAGSAAFIEQLTSSLPWLTLGLRAVDFTEAKRAGDRIYFLNCQPSARAPISHDLGLLREAHQRGLRMLMLTYNQRDHTGCGCTSAVDDGLTSFGREVVELLNDLGVIVDVAHCGPRTTLDACERSTAPVVASHTSASAVYRHDRGKSDEELDAIARTGGVVSVYAVPFFLSSRRDASIEMMLDHVDYIAKKIGWQHVGVGTDWPPAAPKEILERCLRPMAHDSGFREEHEIEATRNLIGFDDYRDFPNVTRGLVARGYSDEQAEGILGANFLRVFASVCG